MTYDRLQATLRALASVGSQPQPGGDLAQAIFDSRTFPTPSQPRQWTPLNKGAAPQLHLSDLSAGCFEFLARFPLHTPHADNMSSQIQPWHHVSFARCTRVVPAMCVALLMAQRVHALV